MAGAVWSREVVVGTCVSGIRDWRSSSSPPAVARFRIGPAGDPLKQRAGVGAFALPGPLTTAEKITRPDNAFAPRANDGAGPAGAAESRVRQRAHSRPCAGGALRCC